MRILVPAFAVFVALGVLSPAVHAAPTAAQLLTSQGCPGSYTSVTADPLASVKARTCNFMAMGVCSFKGVNCNGFFPSNIRPPGASKEGPIEGAATDAMAKKGNDLRASAQKCCGTGSCPELLPEGALQAKAMVINEVKKQQKDGTASINQSQNVMATGSLNSSIENSGYAGTCRAYIALCIEQFTNVRKVAQGKDVQIAENGINACKALSAKAFDDNALYHAQNQKKAEDGGKGTEEKPGDRNDRVADGGNSSSSGLNGPMMQALLPMLAQALMGQQEQPPVDPMLPEMPMGDCSQIGPDGLPVLAGCPLNMAQPQAAGLEQGMGDTRPASMATGEGSFNLADNADDISGAQGVSAGGGSGTPITTAGVQNGGGGGIPGAGGAAPASLGAAASGGAQGKGINTDILGPERGGGGGGLAAMNQGMQMQTGGNGGYNYGNGGGSEFENLRLADYLPGGAKDPGATRGLAGLAASNSMQIQGKGVNIWNRVSEIFRSRCAQGLLRDCGPR